MSVPFEPTYAHHKGTRLRERYCPDVTEVTLTLIHDSTSKHRYIHDDLNRMGATVNSDGKRIICSYDAVGQRSEMVDPDGGRFTYAYDDAGRTDHLINPEDQRTTWAYDAAGRVTSQLLANGTRASYTYDDADRIVVLANIRSSGTTISSFEYSYDAVGNRMGVVEANGDRVTWTYDNTYQLTRERRSGANACDITYTYDAAGNRLTKEESGVVTTYAYDAANELLTSEDGSGVTTYTYDAAGNLAASVNPSEEATTYGWDYENRLAAVELPGGVVNTFTYKSDGLRVQKEDSAGTTRFIWDGAKIVAETDENDTIEAVYTQSPNVFGDLVSQKRGDTTKFFHFDALGSTDRLTNAAQAVSDSYLYEAFGKIIASTGSTPNPFRFVGKLGYYFDADLLECYLRARHYSPSLGRFVSRDIRGKKQSKEAYVYAYNNPLLYVDPSGRQGCLLRRLHIYYFNDDIGSTADADPYRRRWYIGPPPSWGRIDPGRGGRFLGPGACAVNPDLGAAPGACVLQLSPIPWFPYVLPIPVCRVWDIGTGTETAEQIEFWEQSGHGPSRSDPRRDVACFLICPRSCPLCPESMGLYPSEQELQPEKEERWRRWDPSWPVDVAV